MRFVPLLWSERGNVHGRLKSGWFSSAYWWLVLGARRHKQDRGPFFHFTYASLSGHERGIDESLAFLRDASLDLVRWRIDNAQREDVRVTHYPELERDQTDRLLPISEIAFSRWDGNPWDIVQGDGGHTESDGVFWMLPYWMGRYYGYIAPPE